MLYILSNKTINTYLPVFPMKGLHNWWHCGPVYIRLYSSTSLFHCKTTIYDMIHNCDSDSFHFHLFLYYVFLYHHHHIFLHVFQLLFHEHVAAFQGCGSTPFSKNGIELCCRAIYMLYAPKLDWLNGWMVDSNCIAIRGNLPDLADITNNVNVRYLWNIHACIRIFHN